MQHGLVYIAHEDEIDTVSNKNHFHYLQSFLNRKIDFSFFLIKYKTQVNTACSFSSSKATALLYASTNDNCCKIPYTIRRICVQEN